MFTEHADFESIQKYCSGRNLTDTSMREGLVFKAVDGSHSFKVISKEYLLGENHE